jgi:hypothetical protein
LGGYGTYATFNNISAISALLVEETGEELPEETNDLSQVTDKLDQIIVVNRIRIALLTPMLNNFSLLIFMK